LPNHALANPLQLIEKMQYGRNREPTGNFFVSNCLKSQSSMPPVHDAKKQWLKSFSPPRRGDAEEKKEFQGSNHFT